MDPLADRVADWAARMGGAGAEGDGMLALRGWALCEELKRCGTNGRGLLETVEGRLGSMPRDLIPQLVRHATESWNNLISDIDREEPNLEHVRRQTRDVFFSVLDALVLVEDSGGPDEAALAQELFNAVVGDCYVFEPMADVAAELRRWNPGESELSDLLCAGIAGLFDGEMRARSQAAAEPVEEFVTLHDFLRESAAAGQTLTPAALRKRMGRIAWWYLKWAAQRMQILIVPKTRDIGLYVWEGQSPAQLAVSNGLDGWEVRVGQGREMSTATIKSGVVALKLPQRIDPVNFICQIKDPASREWVELFGRVEAEG